MIRFGILIFGSLLLNACASPPRDAGSPSITFSRRVAGLCMSACPNYDLTLRSDGMIEVKQHMGFKEHYRFRVAPADAAAAFAEVATLRSRASPRSSIECARHPPEVLDPKVVQFAIEWRGASSPERVLACVDDKDVTTAFAAAIRALGAYPESGHPLVRERPDGTRYGQRVSCYLGNGRWSPPRFDCYDCPPPPPAKSSIQFYAINLATCRRVQ